MSQIDFDSLFKGFRKLKVGVIGDLMLDTYWWGKVDRISPEAPVPVVAVTKKEQRIGGAGNVALNVQSLGAEVHAISVLGEDAEGTQLQALLSSNNIGIKYLRHSNQRLTTNKIRIIGRNQHMMRLDAEVTVPISDAEEEMLLAIFTEFIKNEKPDVVILEDYNKGVLTPRVIKAVIDVCRENDIITAVDPKRKNFFAFTHADIFKPNLHEAKEGLSILADEVNSELLTQIHHALFAKLQHRISLITLSEKGIFVEGEGQHAIIPTHIRSIADVSGAGDTVIAVASVVYAATRDIRLMAEMANIAGGLVCEEVGTVAINREKLLDECRILLR